MADGTWFKFGDEDIPILVREREAERPADESLRVRSRESQRVVVEVAWQVELVLPILSESPSLGLNLNLVAGLNPFAVHKVMKASS